MAKILLDYFMPISVIESIPEVSTAFLKQVCVVCKPGLGQEGDVGTIFECVSMAEVGTHTANANVQKLFDAGMTKVFILLADDLDIGDFLLEGANEFFTVLISDDFGDSYLAAGLSAASIKFQDITFTAKTPGSAGNDITVTYTDDNTGGAADASAIGSDITVSIEAGVTTAATIAAAIASDTDSNLLVSTSIDSGDETDPQTDDDTQLEGGTDATIQTPAVAASKKIQDITYTAKTAGEDGDDIAIIYTNTNTGGAASSSATGSVITVSIESGVTTAATIATAVGADTASNDLVATAVDSGDESDPQVTQGSTALENGAEAVEAAVGTIDVGAFDGVVGFSSEDEDVCSLFAGHNNQAAFFTGNMNGAKNMMFAFGKLLSNLSDWKNQQFIPMPVDDGITNLGTANTLFDDRVSFVITDDEFGSRLAMFAVGGKAIVSPYIKKNLRLDLQSRAITWISANQPQYTLTNAALLEQRLQNDVIEQKYVQTQWIEKGIVSITLVQDNFVGTADINITEPTALWRIFGEMSSTL